MISSRKKLVEKSFVQFSRHYSEKFDLLIVGGGIMGSSTAHWIKQRTGAEFSVGVVEPDPSYSTAATTLSVGGLRQQFSLHENVKIGIFARDFMNEYPYSLLNGKSKDDLHPNLPDVRFQRHGYLFLASEAGQHILEDNHRVQIESGARTKILNTRKLKETFPWLETDGLVSGCYGGEDEGWFDPWALLQAFKLQAIHNGAEYITGRVSSFQYRNERPGSATISLQDGSTRSLEFNQLLITAGGDSGELGLMAGIGSGSGDLQVPIPVEKRKRYVYVPHCPQGPGLDCPLVIDPTGVYFRREGLGGNYLCGQSPTEQEEPRDTNLEQVDMDWFDEAVWPVLANRVKAFETLKVKTAWAGNYDYNHWDQNGIIGRHPVLENVFMACGFSGHGIQQGPAVGRAMSECILDGGFKTLDLSRFGFERLQRQEKVLERNIV
ncbi:FAD-dependent oxidoreductase domain-containing protein 1 isoform X2 [Eurytemora carolleeae]|uniref:FAD-dependent oxidoreductase domain-containing protein 1 isoform X2 n=1 Tax=Eurytemora carolleeae TaxID=1294199 RepID=UPI000C7659A0|nr:FAD-dependent oxidoreductase domain-containing protein 1 isoform X2 [Eurytemora carolleeae]|eukprot:XP_023335944.1 FAD-dependent oxidoreductase domain-containing protein 1-like isoform X2 [Eurytemora affinis]